jgi:hypothetical protein
MKMPSGENSLLDIIKTKYPKAEFEMEAWDP